MRTTSIITLAAAAAVLMMLSPAPEVQAAETMKPEQCLMCHGGSFDALREQTKNWKDELDHLSSPISTLTLMPLIRMPAQRLCRSARAAIRLTRFRFPRTSNPNPPHCRCATGAIIWRISKSAAMQAATKIM